MPSYSTSSADWRTGMVDEDQCRGFVFRAASDCYVWDADLHSPEMIGRYLFLTRKSEIQQAVWAAY